MRKLILGAALALALGGAAQAADFVVVSSTEPSLLRGQQLASGAVLTIAPGRSVVLIDPAGQVTRLAGSAKPVTLPRRQMASVDAERMQVLKLLVAPPRVRRAGPNLEKICPDADLTKFEGIVAVAVVDGCLTTARTAFEAYVAKAAGSEAP
jgi:hypothetical protein